MMSLKIYYILVEYHFSKKEIYFIYTILKKIYKSHQVFYIHCSPFAEAKIFGNNRLCSALEVSYILRSGNNFSIDKSIYPIQEFSYGHKEGFNINILKLFDNYKQKYF